jgi:hypothetical protein
VNARWLWLGAELRFGELDGVLEQHGHGREHDAAEARRDPRGLVGDRFVHIR